MGAWRSGQRRTQVTAALAGPRPRPRRSNYLISCCWTLPGQNPELRGPRERRGPQNKASFIYQSAQSWAFPEPWGQAHGGDYWTPHCGMQAYSTALCLRHWYIWGVFAQLKWNRNVCSHTSKWNQQQQWIWSTSSKYVHTLEPILSKASKGG